MMNPLRFSRGVRFTLSLLLIWTMGISFGQGASAKEYQLKAVFIFNFAQFVEWPTDAHPESHDTLVIGILGKDPFGPYLEEVVRGEKIMGHPITIKRFRQSEEIEHCRILFIGGSESSHLQQDLDDFKKRHILTIGESEDFSISGGMIRFATENTKLRLKINLQAIQEANLTVSSKLLRLAEIVTREKG